MTAPKPAAPRRMSAPPPIATGHRRPAGQAKSGYQRDVTTPLKPIIVLAVCTLVALVLVIVAFSQSAGTTDRVSGVAVLAWVVGSVLGLLVFAWFRSADVGCRSEPRYVEPGWRPRRVAVWLAVVGWTAGSLGAFLVAEALARR